MELIRTKLDALKKLAENLGVDSAETERCVTNNDALNLIAQHLGGDADARTNAEAIGNIAEVASAGGGGSDLFYTADRLTHQTEMADQNAYLELGIDLKIPDTVTELGEGAFAMGFQTSAPYMVGLIVKSVTIPASIETIPSGAFMGNNLSGGLECNAKIIKDYAFAGVGITGTLNSITLGAKLEEIGDYAFTGCLGLTNISLPSSVKRIGANAFSGCNNVTYAQFNGANIESIGENAFAGVTKVNITGAAEGDIEGAPWGAGAVEYY